MTGVRSRLVVYPVAAIAVMVATAMAAGKEENRKANLSLRLTPSIAFSPVKVSAVAELRGTPDSDEKALLYCAATEWDWGDGTRSEAQIDCEPYEEGRSALKRRYSAQHLYNESGRYRVQLRLKRNNRILLTTNSNVQIRPGAQELSGQ